MANRAIDVSPKGDDGFPICHVCRRGFDVAARASGPGGMRRDWFTEPSSDPAQQMYAYAHRACNAGPTRCDCGDPDCTCDCVPGGYPCEHGSMGEGCGQ